MGTTANIPGSGITGDESPLMPIVMTGAAVRDNIGGKTTRYSGSSGC